MCSIRAVGHAVGVGRPRGSTDGRTPPGGYPPVSAETAAFLSGYLEGEACFGLSKQIRGFGFRPTVSVVTRSDDGDLLRGLQAATRIGRINHRAARRTSRPQVLWAISAKMDCRRLVELLDEHPPRGRKAAAYAPWRASVLRWAAGDGTTRLTAADWCEFPEWKAEIERANRFDPSRADCAAKAGRAGRHWCAYLAGLVTAEGCFQIDRNGRARCSIHMRADDLALLRHLRAAAGLGRVYGPRPAGGRARHPSAVWRSTRSRKPLPWPACSSNRGQVDESCSSSCSGAPP